MTDVNPPANREVSILGIQKDPSVSLDNNQWVSAAAVAAALTLSQRTVLEYAARGILPSIKLGKHRRFHLGRLADALKKMEGICDTTYTKEWGPITTSAELKARLAGYAAAREQATRQKRNAEQKSSRLRS